MAIILEKSKELLVEKRYTFSIMWKIMVLYLALIVIIAAMVSVYVFGNLRGHFIQQNEEQNLNTANITADVVGEYISDTEEIAQQIRLVGLADSIRCIIVDMDTNVRYDNSPHNSLQGKKFVKPAVATALTGKDTSNSYQENGAGWVVEVAVPIIKNGQTGGVVYLSSSLENEINFVQEILINLLMLIGAFGIVFGVIAFIIAKRITKPVVSLTKSITQMPINDLQKVDIESHDEVAKLAMAFNALIDKLDALEEKRRLFVSDASHELKTPLATIKLIADSIIQTETNDPEFVKEFLGDLNDEVDRLTRIVNKLLSLTKLDEAKSGTNYENINIVEGISSIIRKLSPLAEQKGINVVFDYADYVLIHADSDKITEAIYNILDNAIKYTPNGGEVRIDLVKDQKNLTISIEDNGPGIPAEDRERIFDRFYRVDNSRTRETGGTGLGLSIADDAIKLHKGHIEVLSEVDKGTKFIIYIPEIVV